MGQLNHSQSAGDLYDPQPPEVIRRVAFPTASNTADRESGPNHQCVVDVDGPDTMAQAGH